VRRAVEENVDFPIMGSVLLALGVASLLLTVMAFHKSRGFGAAALR
jgi:hypothetical protein